jgi:hypothetical protein
MARDARMTSAMQGSKIHAKAFGDIDFLTGVTIAATRFFNSLAEFIPNGVLSI